MVKNEVDIIDAVIRHQLDQGLSRILVVDNMSTDGTRDLLYEMAEALPISVGTDSEPGYYQAHKMSQLAAAARRAGAEWVVPFDADEFWFAPGTTVADYLRASSLTRVEALIYNAFPTPAAPVLAGLAPGMRFDLSPHLLVKVAARPHPLLWIGMGNHSALRPGTSGGGLRVIHLPWRSPQQLTRKIRQGAEAYRRTRITVVGGHWRSQDRKSDGSLQQTWEDLLNGDVEPGLGWRPVGPFSEIDVTKWRTWNPDGAVPEDLPVQRPTF